jgi:hypothetical protein
MKISQQQGTLFQLVETLRRKAPAYLDLLTAQSDEEFEKAFDALLEQSVGALERNKTNFETLDEVSLSGAFALALSIPGLSVTQEAHSNGHVDITIVADHCIPARRKLGEAKIWDGAKYHIEGLKQLLGRYTTGREGRGLLIEYVKTKNIKGLLQTLRQTMNAERPCNQTMDAIDHLLKWSFVSTHAHTCGDDLEVGHIGCNLFTEPKSDSAS